MEKFPLPDKDRLRSLLARIREESVDGVVVVAPVAGRYVAMPAEMVRSGLYEKPMNAVFTDTAHWTVYRLLHEAIPLHAPQRQQRVRALGLLSMPSFLRYYTGFDHTGRKLNADMVEKFASRFAQGDGVLEESLQELLSTAAYLEQGAFTQKYLAGKRVYMPSSTAIVEGRQEFGRLLSDAMHIMGMDAAQLSQKLASKRIDFTPSQIRGVMQGKEWLPEDARYEILATMRIWNKQTHVEKIDIDPLRNAAVDAGFDTSSKRGLG